jgi:hypothetical protein
MDNHYHLLLELIEANLSRAVQWLNASNSIWFNRRHERSGHLFQGRFKSVAVNPEEWALYLGRWLCGLKLAELAQEVGLRNYGVVATNAKRYEGRLARDRTEKARMKRVLKL